MKKSNPHYPLLQDSKKWKFHCKKMASLHSSLSGVKDIPSKRIVDVIGMCFNFVQLGNATLHDVRAEIKTAVQTIRQEALKTAK